VDDESKHAEFSRENAFRRIDLPRRLARTHHTSLEDYL
jgi:hypothetical protein